MMLDLESEINEEVPVTGSCPSCGRYIKFIYKEKNLKLPFGKYKSRSISSIAQEDSQYLIWLLSVKVANSLKYHIHNMLVKYNKI